MALSCKQMDLVAKGSLSAILLFVRLVQDGVIDGSRPGENWDFKP